MEDAESIVQKLRNTLDLTLYEAKLYLALLQGAKDPREASVKSGVPLPRIYDVIKVLESKGFVYKDPNGWYIPVSPSSLAIATIARLEEESRRRAREVEELARELEAVFERPRPAPITMVRGAHMIVSTALDYFRSSDRVYVVAISSLIETGLVGEIVRALAPHVPTLRIIASDNVDLQSYAGLVGVSVKRLAEVASVDSLISKESTLVALRDPSSGEPVAVALRDPLLSGRYFERFERLWEGSTSEL